MQMTDLPGTVWILAACVLYGCSGGEASDSDGGLDAATAGDADSDSDADADTDGDSDTDSDGDSDSDSDTDSDSDVDTSGWTDAGLDLDELCVAFVDDLCASLMQCYGIDWGWDYADMDHCRADQECLGMDGLRADIELGYLVYDPAAAEACHEEFVADPCWFRFLFLPDVYGVLSVCGDVLTGQQEPGDTCLSKAGCSPLGECYPTGECPGTCVAWAEEGEACDWELGPECDPTTEQECRNGFCTSPSGLGGPCDGNNFCDDELMCNDDGVCQELGSEGDPCMSDFNCADGFWCDVNYPDPGTCVPLGGEGDPCYYWDDHCIEGLYCVPETPDPLDEGVCGPQVGEGEPCNSDDDCEDGLTCEEDYCVVDPDPGPPGFGDECAGWFDECGEGLTCDGEDDLCYWKVYPGASCADPDTRCVNSLCISGVCEYRFPLGAPCAEDNDCASKACDGVCYDDESCVP